MKYSQIALAKAAGLSQQTISVWVKAGKIAPDIMEGKRKFYSDAVLAEVLKLKGNKPSAAQVTTTEAKHDDAPVEGKKIIANDGEKNSEQNNHVKNTTNGGIRQCLSNLPAELLAQPRFFALCGTQKKDTPKGWSNPDNQRLFSELDSNRLLGFDTCGHDRAEDYLVIDFDHCLNDAGNFVSEDVKEWYFAIKRKFGGCYCELSISKHGLHFIGKPTKGKFQAISNGKSGVLLFDKANDVKIELFYKTKARYFLFTGNCYECDAQAPIPQGAVVDEIFQDLLDAIAKQNHVAETPNTHNPLSPRQPARKQETEKTAADLGNDYDLFRADLMLDAINPADLPDSDWLAVNSACKNIGVPYHVVDTWNHRDSNRYNEEENLERWNSATDPSFNIETLHGIAKRFNYEEADARREWYQLHPDQSNDNIVYTRDRIKDCPVNLILPENFIWTKQGITQLVPSKKDTEDFKKLPVTKTPIIITKEFREPTKGTVEYEIALRVRDQWNYTILDGKTLADARQLTELGNYAAIINDVGRLKQFFDALRACNPDLPQIKTYKQTGWTNSDCETFAYPTGDKDYIVRRAGFDYEEIFKPKGNAELWKQKFEEVSEQGGAIARITIGAIAASCLVKPLGLPNLQVHIDGKSGIGKSALPEFGASIYGDPSPGALTRTFSATMKNRLELATAFCDLPQILDELETLSKRDEENLSNSIYEYSLGICNQAQKRDGTAREAKRFSGARISTGERPILKQNDKHGAYKRVLALHAKTLFDDDFAFELHNFSKRNRGLFGYQWTQYVTKNIDIITKHFDDVCATIKRLVKGINSTQLKSLAVSAVAYQHFKICIGLQDSVTCADAMDKELGADLDAIIATLPADAEIDDTARAIESLTSFVASHEKYFLRNQKDTDGEEMTFTFANETYGKIFDTGEVAFFPTALKKILEDELKFASADKLIASWSEQEKLVTNGGRKDHVIKIAKKTYKVIHFKANIISTDTDSVETSYYESLGVIDS